MLCQDSPRLRLMTFNIRYGTANDGDNRWALRRHTVPARIRANDADVVGLQEALPFQVAQLRIALPEYEFYGIGRERDGGGETCTVLVRASRLVIEKSGTFWLGKERGVRAWDAALPRIASWVVLRDRKGHQRFVVVNTHFDHRGRKAREESGKLIGRWLQRFPELPKLVLGDLNTGENTPPLTALQAAGLRDTFRVVHPDAGDVGTFHGFRGRAGPAKIDYVLASEGVTVHKAAIDRSQDGGRYCSDHYPVTAVVSMPSAAPPKLMPVLDAGMWHIGDNPDLGRLTTPRQEVVDHAIWRARDGTWQLWACIRGTSIGRLLYAWEGDALEQVGWRRRGIAMRALAAAGESLDDWGGKEWIQAPHVIEHGGVFHMLYGGHRSELEHCQICLARSRDGREFTRYRNAMGMSRVFVGPGEARDPMTLRIGDTYYCYYAGNPDPRSRRDTGRIYCRTSKDFLHWSQPVAVNFGGVAGSGMWDAECPHVVAREGWLYLFRTTDYRMPLTYVYRSDDPLDFGRGNDDKLVVTIAVAAPEIVSDRGRDYISSVHDLRGGIQLGRLRWIPEGQAPTTPGFVARLATLWDFEDGTLDGWTATGDAFAHQPTYADSARVRNRIVDPQGRYFVGTYEKRPDASTKPGSSQGDAPTGTLRSPEFVLPAGHLAFLVAGGRDKKRLFVSLHLVAGDQEIARATGHGNNRLRRVVWDVGAHAGERAYVRIVDQSSDPWGHINVDDFRIER